MSDKKNPFQRAFDAVVESRMRRAEHEVALYCGMFELNSQRKAR